MFNSQRVNNDPFPYISPSGSRNANPGWMGSEYFSNRRERKEYDNNPNPMLLRFRESVGILDDELIETAKWYLEDMLHVIWFEDSGSTDEEYEHARKVLERLVNVYGTD